MTGRPKFRGSAAVILIRGHGGSLEVFWVRRSEAVSYMPRFHAFPGGTVLGDDAEVPLEGAASEADRIVRACAIREAFEETGALVGLEGAADPIALAEARRALLAGEAHFSELARARGWRFRGGALEFAARWMTPPFASARFDTSFFLARLPDGQEATVRVGELESGEWTAPAAALERWKQGRAAFAPPILHSLVELARGETDLAARLAEGPERSRQPVRRIELVWGIVLHPMQTRPLPPATHTNAYLVGDRDMALIDPGSGDPGEIEQLCTLIGLLEADGRRLAHVVVTHHHPDHIGGVEAIRARYRIPVWAHADTAPHVRADRLLADGDRLPLASAVGDWSLRALHTPGHARGHLCLLHPPSGSLLTGDHVTGAGTVIVDPPEGDMADYVTSLERLLGERVEMLFPAHGSPHGAPERRLRGLIAHRIERESKVLAALEDEPRALAELVERAYQDTPRELWGYAERSLLAHLIKLEHEGSARRDGEGWRLP